MAQAIDAQQAFPYRQVISLCRARSTRRRGNGDGLHRGDW
jgi:hypothetical protein